MRLPTRALSWVCAAVLGLALAGCGQKGPLTLATPAAPASAPAR